MGTTRYAHLCEAERYMITTGLEAGHSIQQIAKHLGRSASSISRELRRNGTNGYAALLAHTQAIARRHKPRLVKKVDIVPLLRSYVFGKVDRYWSPQQISARLKMDFPDNPDMRVSHETIYAYIYAMPKSRLHQELTTNLRRKHPGRQRPPRALQSL